MAAHEDTTERMAQEPTSSIHDALNTHDSAIDRLEETIERMTTQLDTVLRAEYGGKIAERLLESVSTNSTVQQRIHALTGRINTLQERLGDLSNRIDI